MTLVFHNCSPFSIFKATTSASLEPSNSELARSSYQKALESGYRSPLLQLKIDDLTAPEKDATPATETQK